MKPTDREHFTQFLVLLGTLVQAPVPPEVIPLYFTLLEDLDFADIQAAAYKLAKTKPGLPKVCHIREVIEGDIQSKAADAIATLERAAFSSGAYQSVAFQDPALYRAARTLGSWPEACNLISSTAWDFRRKDFIALYCSYAGQLNTKDTIIQHLPGRLESENAYEEVEFYGKDGRLRLRGADKIRKLLPAYKAAALIRKAG